MTEKESQELERILQKDLYTALLGNETKRIAYVEDIVYCLQGAYNQQGIRNWFYRRRSELGGKNPLEYLGPDWKPDDEKAKDVLKLAQSLIG